MTGYRVFDQFLRHQAGLQYFLSLGTLAQGLRQGQPQRARGRGAPAHESIQARTGAQLQQFIDVAVESPGFGQAGEVQHLVADGDSAAECLVADAQAEHGERQILDREIGAVEVGRLDPAVKARVMGLIEVHWRIFRDYSGMRSAMLPSCIQRACSGALRVSVHSLSMSHLTSSSRVFISAVSVLAASSRR